MMARSHSHVCALSNLCPTTVHLSSPRRLCRHDMVMDQVLMWPSGVGVVCCLYRGSGPRRQLLLVGHHRLCVPRTRCCCCVLCAVRSCTPPDSSYPLTNPRVLEIRSCCLAGCCRSIELPPPKSNSPRPAPQKLPKTPRNTPGSTYNTQKYTTNYLKRSTTAHHD